MAELQQIAVMSLDPMTGVPRLAAEAEPVFKAYVMLKTAMLKELKGKGQENSRRKHWQTQ